MWGFFAAWVWDTVREFLIKECYEETALTPGDILITLRGVVAQNGWWENKNTKMCRLYLIGKAKSLFRPEWLWQSQRNPSPSLIAKPLW